MEEAGESDGGRVLDVVEEKEGGEVEVAREREGGEGEERVGRGVEEEAREREGGEEGEREGGRVEEEAREREGRELIGQVEGERERVPAAERRVGVAQSKLKRRKNRTKKSNEIKAPNQVYFPIFHCISCCRRKRGSAGCDG